MTRQSPPGSVGAAIYPLLSAATSVVHNAAAGNVGDFYEAHKDLLNSPATDANIEEFTRLETEFFKSQGGAAAVIASALSAEMRAHLVEQSRDRLQGK